MTRRKWLFGLAVLAGCGKRSAPPAEVLPPTVQYWNRVSVTRMAATSAPEVLRNLGVRSLSVGSYRGPTDIRITAYEMPTDASAFEARQKWRTDPGTAFFQHKKYFVIAQTQDADKTALNRFVNAMEMTWKD